MTESAGEALIIKLFGFTQQEAANFIDIPDRSVRAAEEAAKDANNNPFENG